MWHISGAICELPGLTQVPDPHRWYVRQVQDPEANPAQSEE
jgi:hypothetical protein